MLALLVLLCLLVASPAAAAPAVPATEGPDIPPAAPPAAVLTAFDGEEFSCSHSAPVRVSTVEVPPGRWDRVILEVTIVPDGDPWDRLFGVAIGGVEVLRGTTPRTAFTLRRDITRYAALLPPGGEAAVALRSGSFVGRLLETVRIELYRDEPTAALVPPPAVPVAGVLWQTLAAGGRVSAQATFPASPPARAVAELTLSGHGADEFWFSRVPPPVFHVLVDGQEVATALPFPYTYAFLGFGNADANTPCAESGTSPFGDTVHPVMWWTAQRAADAAGVHLGVGEIPPYRGVVDEASLGLLSGTRTVEVVQEGGRSYWPASLAFLLD